MIKSYQKNNHLQMTIYYTKKQNHSNNKLILYNNSKCEQVHSEEYDLATWENRFLKKNVIIICLCNNKNCFILTDGKSYILKIKQSLTKNYSLSWQEIKAVYILVIILFITLYFKYKQ